MSSTRSGIPKTMNSSGSSSISSSEEFICVHRLKCAPFVSETEKNPLRRFVRCPLPKVRNCGFWEWVDPALLPFQKDCYFKLKVERDKLQDQLRCKMVLEKLLYESLYIKKVELADKEGQHLELSCRIAELEYQIQNLNLKNRDLQNEWKSSFMAEIGKKDA